MKKYLLPQSGNFYKTNLHTHSTISDGNLTPQEIKELYKANGYSVVAYTDHDLFIPHHELTDDTFLALSGFEAEFNEFDSYPVKLRTARSCHLCFIAKKPDMNVQPCFNPEYAYIGNAKEYHSKINIDESTSPYERHYSPESINTMIEIGRKSDFFVTYNHPTWSLEDYRSYTAYKGLNAMEILNYAVEAMGYPSYVPNIYDDMLRSGQKIFAVAADDNHNKHPHNSPYGDSCGGWIMIKAEKLEYETITDALFAGNFYASSGPEIYDLYVEDSTVHISCSDAVKITFSKNGRGPKIAAALSGEHINHASFAIDNTDTYFRLTVTDAQGHHANTNAYYTEDLK